MPHTIPRKGASCASLPWYLDLVASWLTPSAVARGNPRHNTSRSRLVDDSLEAPPLRRAADPSRRGGSALLDLAGRSAPNPSPRTLRLPARTFIRSSSAGCSPASRFRTLTALVQRGILD